MAAPTTPHVDVHRGGDRLKTRTAWLDSKHSFSFGAHYDPENTHHGLLLVNNDDVVAPGAGFDPHPHRDMEIVTWVLSGSLVHQDSLGHAGVIHPGLAQRVSAGTGIEHSERNDAWRLDGETPELPAHFIQMWVIPDESGRTPEYQQQDVAADLADGALVPIASGLPRYRDSTAITINSRHSALHVARLRPGGPVALPEAPYLHLFVSRGEVAVEGIGQLYSGDAVRLSRDGARQVLAAAEAEILVWEMHARLGGMEPATRS